MRNVPDSAGACPTDIDEIAEAHVMDKLPTTDALQFAIHLRTCSRCAAAVEEAGDFVRSIRAALVADAMDKVPM
jgi:anti-sigma factor RsiW